MFERCRLVEYTSIIDVTILSKGIAFIRTIMGDLTLSNIDEDIEKVLNVVDFKNGYVYVITNHYDKEAHYIDEIKIREEKLK